MRPRLALSIGAVLYVVPGVALLVAPGQVLSAFGWPAIPTEMLVVARDAATLLISLAIINWLARDAVGAPLRGLLWGNIFLRVAGTAINVWELAVGLTPSTLGSTLAILIAMNIAVVAMFALALRRA